MITGTRLLVVNSTVLKHQRNPNLPPPQGRQYWSGPSCVRQPDSSRQGDRASQAALAGISASTEYRVLPGSWRPLHYNC